MLRKAKTFISGILVGAIIASTVPVIADALKVEAFKDDTISIELDGQRQQLPEGYDMLSYQARTYLPSRYVAEKLGAKVEWVDSTRTIKITSPEPKIVEKEVEKIVYVDKPGSTSLQGLPASSSADGVVVTINNVALIGARASTTASTRLSCKVENKNSGDNINIDYASVVVTVDGKEYKTVDTNSVNWDSAMMSTDLKPDDEISGFFVIPTIPTSSKEFTMKVPVRNQTQNKLSTIELSFTTKVLE